MQYNFTPLRLELKKIEDFLSKEYAQLNAGRATPSVLDGVMVEAYGAKSPLKNTASISIEDPKTLRVAPWDKSQIKSIEKGILLSNLGVSVVTDSDGLRVIFPQLTTETRNSLVKVLKEKLEEARITVRRERESVLKNIEVEVKAGKMNEDERFKAKSALQKVVDEVNKNLENIFVKKEKEVMG